MLLLPYAVTVLCDRFGGLFERNAEKSLDLVDVDNVTPAKILWT